MTLDLQAIADWNVRQRAARKEYYAHLNHIETHDPSLCIEPGCDDLREEIEFRCAAHLAERSRARKAIQRANERLHAKRNPGSSAERVRRYRQRQKEKGQ